jgi:hypothetical protein
MTIEAKLTAFFHEPDAAMREGRVERNMQMFHLDRQSAIILDECMINAVSGCIALLGRSIDDLSVQGGLRSAGVRLFPEVLARNTLMIHKLVTEIEMLMFLDDGEPVYAPNPDNPDCECAACAAIRELSSEMMLQPSVSR